MSDLARVYTAAYFNDFSDISRRSAHVVVPIIMQWVNPASVLDLGCGVGAWLAAFKEAGVKEIRGVDGDYVERDLLQIPEDAFSVHDLTKKYTPDRKYGLSMSVEAAEHIQAESAPLIVESLTEAAPVVLFSAAIPHQPGGHHVNLQWPAYWADLFAQRGYAAIDALRPLTWENALVGWWYRQNIALYVRQDELGSYPELEKMYVPNLRPLPLIHPEMYQALLVWAIEQEQKYWALWAERDRGTAEA